MAASRPHPRARWATCALALLIVAIAVPAAAQPKKAKKRPAKASVSTCAYFDQIDKEEEEVDLVVDNRCDVRLSCSVSWTLVCAPGTRKAQRFQRSSAFALETLKSQSTTASAAECGNDGWMIDDVVWQCRPEPAATP